MEIQTKTKKNNVVLNLHGDIDSYNSSVLKDIITTKMDQNELNITVNLADVGYIDSKAIEVLFTCLHDAKQRQGCLKIIDSDESTMKNHKIVRSLQFDSLHFHGA